MLSPADAEIAARDTRLPGLAAVLDAPSLARRAGLGTYLACYLRYKPGTSCVAGLLPAAGGLGALTVMTYPAERYAEIRARSEWREGPEPALFLDDICTALVPLRHDRKLKAAHRLCCPKRRTRYLAKLGLEGAVLTLLRYKPGRRLVLRADLPSGCRAILKAHGQESFVAAAQGARHADRVAGLPCLAMDGRRGVVVSAWIDGAPLDPEHVPLDAVRGAGAELARLHLAAALPDRPARGIDLGPAAEAVANLRPGLAERAAALAATLAEHQRGRTRERAVLHGDFSADQVVLSGKGATLIDWDRLDLGDPGRDLGSFLARLDVDVLEGSLPQDRAGAVASALLAGYSETRGCLPDGVEIHRAGALLALASEGFRRRRADWAKETEAILARAETLVPGPRTTETSGLAASLDTATMTPKLAAALGVDEGAALEACLLRHRAGRRALIRYTMGDAPPVLGKLRAKGPDRRTPALHRALRAAGLDGRAPQRVGVPEPVAEIDDPPVWLQRQVPGDPLTGLLGRGDAREPAYRTGTALAMLHDTAAGTRRTWTMADEIDVIDRALRTAAGARPELESAIEHVRRLGHAVLGTLPGTRATGLHRDFYPDQVLIDGETVWLVDLDLYAAGDPVIDVGNFLAHLTELGLREHADADRFAPECGAFLSGYETLRGDVDRERLRALHWGSLIRHIGISQRIAERGHTTEALIALCAEGPGGPAFGHPSRCAA